MDGVSGAASVIAVVDLSAKVVSLCSQYYTTVKNAKADIEQLQEEINRLDITLKDTQRLLDSPNGVRLQTSERLADGLPGCCIQLKDLETKLAKKLEHKTAGRLRELLGGHALKWPFQSKDVEKIIRNLNKFRDALSTALTLDQTMILLGNERIEILEWVSPVPYGKHHNTVKDARTSGTCEWLLLNKIFHEWENTRSSMILWLQGSPGAGKTFLTSRVIDHVQHSFDKSQDDEGFAFFYCNRNEEERRKPLMVLRSFVRQLSARARFPTEIRKKVQKIWSEKRLGASDLSLTDCREQLLESVNLYTRTTLVLDALDECEPESRAELVKTIEILLAQSKQPLRVFISSRPDRDIRDKFLSRPNIEIETKHNEKDIQRFVNEEIIKHGNWIDMSPLLKEEIIKTLLERSQGMFQWVFLQIKQILDLETEVAIRDRLGRLPTSLKSAYDEIYNKVQARHKLDRALADRAFIWVMGARYPLKSEELLSAIRLDTEGDTFDLSEKISESRLLHLCNNLLVLDSQQNVWRFSHLSVREYFEENHYSLYEAHSRIAKACLQLLIETYKESKDGSDYRDRETNHDNRRFGFFEKRHPLQMYSRHHWITHIQTQYHDADIALVRLLKRFLGSFSESSVQYQKWNHQLSLDFTFRPHTSVFTDIDPCEIRPGNAAIFFVCRFSIYTLLADWWVDAKIPLWQKNESGSNLLELAASTGCRPICEVLIKRGMDVNAHSGKHGSALAAAISNGHIEIVKFLVRECGADPNVDLLSGSYSNVLVAAVSNGHIKIVKFLVRECGADPNVDLLNGDYSSVLVAAVSNGHIEIVKFLVRECGADPNVDLLSGDYSSVLAAAVSNGYIEIVKFLVRECGADPNVDLLSGNYSNVLAMAVALGDIDTVKFLVQEGGADSNMVLQAGTYGNPLIVAAARGDINIVKFLIQEGRADPNLVPQVGEDGSPLIVAAARGRIEIVKFLVQEGGADPNAVLQGGRHANALAAAASNGRIKTVKFLIQEGKADPNTVIQVGRYGSPLSAAASNGKNEIVEFLVRKGGADPNMVLQTGEHGSALAAAIDRHNVDIVKFLIQEGGTNPSMPLQIGGYDTAAALAKDRKYTEIIELLAEEGKTDLSMTR